MLNTNTNSITKSCMVVSIKGLNEVLGRQCGWGEEREYTCVPAQLAFKKVFTNDPGFPSRTNPFHFEVIFTSREPIVYKLPLLQL